MPRGAGLVLGDVVDEFLASGHPGDSVTSHCEFTACFFLCRLPNAPNAQTLCLRLAPSQPTHLQSHDAAQSEGRSPFVCCPNVARDLPRKHDCSRNVKSSLAFARVYLRTARRHSVTSEEVLSVLAAPDEYELERGVWYLLEAPSTLAVSHSACVLSARFGLSDDDLFNLLQPAAIPDFRIAKESTWRAAFTKAGLTAVVFKPEQEERKIASYGRLRYMQYRLESAEYIV